MKNNAIDIINKKNMVSYLKRDKDGSFVLIQYKRRKKKPTLKQYAIRNHFGNIAKLNKGETGLIKDGEYIKPKISGAMKECTGIKAENLINDNIIKEYNEKYKRKKKKGGD